MTRRLLALWRETVANLIARPATTTSAIVLLSTLFLLVFVNEHNTSATAADYADQLRHDGMFVYVIQASTGAALNATDCVSLNQLDGVDAAIAMAGPVNAHLYAEAGPVIPVWFTTGPLAQFTANLAAHPGTHPKPTTGAIDVDSNIGRIGDQRVVGLSFPTGTTTPTLVDVDIVDLSPLGDGLAGNALIPAPRQAPQPSVCLITTADDSRDAIATAAALAFPKTDGFSQRWALSNAERFEDGRTRFETRPSLVTWLAATIIVCVLFAMYARLRRNDLAVYAANGLRPGKVATIGTLEILIVNFIATAIAAAAATIMVHTNHTSGLPVQAASAALARVCIATALVAAPVVALMRPRSIIDALKDR